MTFPYRLSAVLMGSAIALVQFQQIAAALKPEEIADIAKQVTVIIGGEDGKGSGVIVDRQGDTYTVVTAHHVIAKAGSYAIQTIDGQKYEVLRSTQIANVDLAQLQFTSKKNYQVADIGNPNLLKEGMTIYYAGYPSNESVTTRDFRFFPAPITRRGQNSIDGYEISYKGDPLPGMSGGPVLDEQGRLIGIHGKAETVIVRETITIVGTQAIPIDKLVMQRPNPEPPIATRPTPIQTPTPTPSPSPSIEPQISASPSPTPQIEVSRNTPESPAESALSKMLQGQATYFKSTGNFTDKPKLLEQTFKIQPPSDYDFPILSNSAARGVIIYGQPRNPNMRTYVGGVFLEQNADQNNPVTVSIICQTIEPIRSRPPYPTYLEGRLSCGAGTELRSASNLPQQNSQSAQPQGTSSPQLGANFNLVSFCSAYDQSSQQRQALEWLQSQFSQEILLEFADKWRSRLVDKAQRRPINLTDACKFYDRTGKHPHQNQALEWLQQQVSQEQLDDFARRWQNQAAGG
ncbi:trypsin-like peptidase domain-containing protein [Kamptonema sp. UHCC 0994]|uniref:trypsin-like peptidase domain-containing protein n=1 Tax=Kamptonema sp. UHCC 0994 TaxID=3031329 RepID=UPI0023B949D8|nr:trypsin-like peptidase domain-containing protein [Kamptonema sp. UHCC 0994]MDF0551937.1 trypsin-like peptidase domain-containing protein [Kamptonema sp. UHCC 0994]